MEVPETVTGALELLQNAFQRVERERREWEDERRQMQAQISRLEGELRSTEYMKKDLMRRILMLEYALRSERSKSTGASTGTESKSDVKPFLSSFNVPSRVAHFPESEAISHRMVLKEFLNAIGATRLVTREQLESVDISVSSMAKPLPDSISPAISTEADQPSSSSPPPSTAATTTNDASSSSSPLSTNSTAASDFLLSSESVDAHPPSISSRPSLASIFDPPPPAADVSEKRTTTTTDTTPAREGGDVSKNDGSEDEAAKLQKQFNVPDAQMHRFMKVAAKTAKKKGDQYSRLKSTSRGNKSLNELLADGKKSAEPSPAAAGQKVKNKELDAKNQMLGELSALEVEPTPTPSSAAGATASGQLANQERKQWKTKFTLRSHFDSVRSIVFHDTDNIIFSGSEDCTVKMWNLTYAGAQSGKRTLSSPDIEPLLTMRGHDMAVTSLAFRNDVLFSGSIDGSIRAWDIPAGDYEPYSSLGDANRFCSGTLLGHLDGIWNICLSKYAPVLLSCSADGTLRVWDVSKYLNKGKSSSLSGVADDDDEDDEDDEHDDAPRKKRPPPVAEVMKQSICYPISLLESIPPESANRIVPVCCDVVHTDSSKCLAAYTSSVVAQYDIETGASDCSIILPRDDGSTPPPSIPMSDPLTQPYRVVCHPTTSTAYTSHENKFIRFLDTRSGSCTHSLVAHQDVVTSLAVDPSGLYLISGGHDASVRVWDLRQRLCVQEISAHRKKFDETIHDLTFHPQRAIFATAGADSNIKVFQ